MIHNSDHPILRAFLEREAGMYQWKPETEVEHRADFITRMFDSITKVENAVKLDYIHIQSLSNLGQVTSELVLTPKNWGPGKSGYFSLPNTPRGGTSLYLRDDK